MWICLVFELFFLCRVNPLLSHMKFYNPTSDNHLKDFTIDHSPPILLLKNLTDVTWSPGAACSRHHTKSHSQHRVIQKRRIRRHPKVGRSVLRTALYSRSLSSVTTTPYVLTSARLTADWVTDVVEGVWNQLAGPCCHLAAERPNLPAPSIKFNAFFRLRRDSTKLDVHFRLKITCIFSG